MMGISVVKSDVKAMVFSGFVGQVVGACGPAAWPSVSSSPSTPSSTSNSPNSRGGCWGSANLTRPAQAAVVLAFGGGGSAAVGDDVRGGAQGEVED
ncbi:hypothetical protein QJS04_geneDACA017160 [Acorus gramineus]|uniref:Uncharacterized protein n=1 Tax=Acorus gramineus TaxID=55184 RepID=A0AAV9BR71_ACOGR|nr:hypothetical protein QJS04_geneDACA017160 [Acorus gramineus]